MKQWEKWSLSSEIKVCNNNHLTVGNWGFRDFANDTGKGIMIRTGSVLGMGTKTKWG